MILAGCACKRPRFFPRRFEHRAWVCSCGHFWVTRRAGAMDGWCWVWERVA